MELDELDGAALERVLARERTPEFLARIERQRLEDEEMLIEYREKNGLKIID